MDSLLLVQQRGQKSAALIQNNGDGSITNNNVWFFSQHQRLGHHIDSSNYDSWEKKGEKKDEWQKQNHRNQSHQWTRTTLHTNAGAEGLKLLRYLERQLPGRGEDQGMKPLG